MSISLYECDESLSAFGMSRRERRRSNHVAGILEARGYSVSDEDYLEEFQRVYHRVGRWGSLLEVRTFGYPTDGTGDAQVEGEAVLERMVADGVDVDRLRWLAGRDPLAGSD
jgi:intein/homing endonuclease